MQCPNCYNEVRDTAKFCPTCGHRITPPHATEVVRPPSSGGAPGSPAQNPPGYTPPPYTPPPYTPPPFEPAVYTPPAGPPRAVASRRRLGWPVVAGLAAVVVLAAAAVWFFFLRGGGSSTAVPQGNRILYGVAESADNRVVFESVSVMNRDGSDRSELAFDRDQMAVPANATDAYAGISPDGRRLALYRGGNNGVELVMMPTDSGAELLNDPDNLWTATDEQPLTRGFAPDGSAFAYTQVNEDEDVAALVVVDPDGAEVARWPDLVFDGFFDDSERLLARRLDEDGNVVEVVTVSLPDGQPQRVVTASDDMTETAPFVFEDHVYFLSEGRLQRVDANGDNLTTIFRFDGEAPVARAVPGYDRLVVLDRAGPGSSGELFIVDTDGENRVRLGESYFVDDLDCVVCGQSLIAGDDHVAYVTSTNDGFSLYVAEGDGSDRRRLIEDREWVAFRFSPDGRHLAFIAGYNAYTGGDLYTVELPDGEPERVTGDVWSLEFAGDRLLYTTADDVDTGSPESAIHSMSVPEGEHEIIFGPEEGLIHLISPVR